MPVAAASPCDHLGVSALVDAVRDAATGARLARDLDQPRVVGKRGRGLVGLLRVERGVETPERVHGFVGHAVGGVRRRATSSSGSAGRSRMRDHVVVGGDGAGVDELAHRRPELLLERAAVRAQEVLVERQHDLRVGAAFLLDDVARRDPDRLGLSGLPASCRWTRRCRPPARRRRSPRSRSARSGSPGCACGRLPSGRS